jgi:hypothetical protein
MTSNFLAPMLPFGGASKMVSPSSPPKRLGFRIRSAKSETGRSLGDRCWCWPDPRPEPARESEHWGCRSRSEEPAHALLARGQQAGRSTVLISWSCYEASACLNILRPWQCNCNLKPQKVGSYDVGRSHCRGFTGICTVPIDAFVVAKGRFRLAF